MVAFTVMRLVAGMTAGVIVGMGSGAITGVAAGMTVGAGLAMIVCGPVHGNRRARPPWPPAPRPAPARSDHAERGPASPAGGR